MRRQPSRVLPFGKVWRLGERRIRRFAHLIGSEPFGQRIDRLDQRQRLQPDLVDDAVGMHHLQGAVVKLGGAGDVARGTDRKQAIEVTLLRAEIGEDEVVGVVAGIDEIRRARAAGRRRPMAIDRDLDRHDRARYNVAQFRPRAPVDGAGRQMEQKIDEPWDFVASKQAPIEPLELRADAGKAGDRRKQGIEQAWAHRIRSD